ncbi:hypothetical protein GOP47_0024070 [Adiantum capillus-veneris]|uniref:AT-rich interactive domain-containing protein 2 n=1 Tax=Adiantum capillus-veneris TaxID=13818 RepID=A0A9D4U579_ADICA|nr:hypothetical protein GOP47_0024070 [Adiantum capillus-veneris]
MGTQALWCFQWAQNSATVDALNVTTAGFGEDFDCEGHSITPRKRVPLGSEFQAEIPKRFPTNNNRTCRSDCELDSLRWLGERVWPMQETKLLTCEGAALRADYRHQECSCKFQDTLECVRLHIKEKREVLKSELGEAFSMWGFDEMGEIVAEKWTHEEQCAFQELVRRNPQSFWHDLFDHFPTKGMTDFVSYYFNVFVLRRRAIQNRINPANIDSDDDEMVLERDERDSDSMLESNEEVGQDAASEDEEENGVMSWPVKDSLVGKCLQGVETARGGEFVESAGSTHEQIAASAGRETSSEGCCGTSNVEDRSAAWELLAWDTKSHGNSAHCVIEHSDKEGWASPLCSTQDELISTKGMMEEFFGSDVGENSK